MTVVVVAAALTTLTAAVCVVARLWQHHTETDMNRWTNTKERG